MSSDDAAMLCFAVRYCLGRHSYAPSLACGVLRRDWAGFLAWAATHPKTEDRTDGR